MNKYLLTHLFTLLFVFTIPMLSLAQNSTCNNATIIEVGTYEVADFTEAGGAVFQGATAAAWYRFEPTSDGVFTVSSCEGGGDTRLVIMLLDDCENTANLQIINSAEDNCSDGKGGNTASRLDVAGSAGFSYVIYWDNGQSDDGFMWNLTFESIANPSEGATCETAIPINTGTHQVDSLTGIGAAFSDAVSAKWYQFKPTATNVLAISACESEVNTRLFVFEQGCQTSQIIGQNDNGCGGSGASILEDEIIVDSGRVYYIYWDDNGSKEGFNFQLDLEELPSNISTPIWAKNIAIYPNPAANRLFIDYDFKQPKKLLGTIYNNLGQLVIREYWTSFNAGKIEILVNNLQDGIYFLHLNADGGQLTRPFMVQR